MLIYSLTALKRVKSPYVFLYPPFSCTDWLYKCSNIGGFSLHSDYGCFDGAHGRNMIEVSQ